MDPPKGNMQTPLLEIVRMTQTPRTVVLSDGYVRRIAVQDEAATQISNWRFVAVKHSDCTVQRHLVGRVDSEGRLSTGVHSLNLQTMRATTASGRVYEVVGDPSDDEDAAYLYSKWLKYGGRTELKDLTGALLRLRRIQALDADAYAKWSKRPALMPWPLTRQTQSY